MSKFTVKKFARVLKFVAVMLIVLIISGCEKDDKDTYPSILGTLWTYHEDSKDFIETTYPHTAIKFMKDVVYFGEPIIETGGIQTAHKGYNYTYSENKISITVGSTLKVYSGTVNGNIMKLYLEDDATTEIIFHLIWNPNK